MLESASLVRTALLVAVTAKREAGRVALFYAPVNGRLIGGGASASPPCFYFSRGNENNTPIYIWRISSLIER